MPVPTELVSVSRFTNDLVPLGRNAFSSQDVVSTLNSAFVVAGGSSSSNSKSRRTIRQQTSPEVYRQNRDRQK